MVATTFSTALRASIAASGLGLDRIQARLHEYDISISVTALSYWQSGKRQPERQSSLSALRALEDILGLAPGSLLSLLPPPRPRGNASRRRHYGATPVLSLAEQPELTLVSLHDRCDVDGSCRRSAVTTRAVVRAAADGQDRWLLAYHQDDPDGATPNLTPLRNCTVGRIEAEGATGLVLAELVFDRTIGAGETYLVEYALTYDHARAPRTTHFREFWQPVPECLLEVRFGDGSAPPRCWQFSRPNHVATPENKDLKWDADSSVHALAVDFGPGVFGIAWP